eukprot:1130383-Alexandrium_andersonii.AAC.1
MGASVASAGGRPAAPGCHSRGGGREAAWQAAAQRRLWLPRASHRCGARGGARGLLTASSR